MERRYHQVNSRAEEFGLDVEEDDVNDSDDDYFDWLYNEESGDQDEEGDILLQVNIPDTTSHQPTVRSAGQAPTHIRQRRRQRQSFKPVTKLEQTRKWSLLTYDELPEFLKDNQYILALYRPELLSYFACILSIFHVHNETINIWSHLIAAVATVIYMITWILEASGMEIDTEEFCLVLGFFVCSSLCFSFSALYHTVSCHSKAVLYFFLKFDYAGIILMVFGTFYSWIYYAYICDLQLRIMYYIVGVLVASGAFIVSFTSYFDRVENRSLRAAVFVIMAATCFTATFHYIFLYGFGSIYERARFGYILMCVMAYGAGGTVYATRLPERFWPGRFNFAGHSHQLFHLLVVIGAQFYLAALMDMFYDRDRVRQCPI